MASNFKAVVVKKDGLIEPKGRIVSIMPGSWEPSGYERSEASPWKVVELSTKPDLGVQPLREIPSSSKRRVTQLEPPNLASRVPCALIDGKIAPDTRVVSSPKKLLGPPTLDRSHSTVWDYGPGRTYSTPQLACEALKAEVGSDPFEEDHYIRGWAGTYYGDATLGVVLAISTLQPNKIYRLYVDRNGTDQVIFTSNNVGAWKLELIPVGFTAQYLVVDGITFNTYAVAIFPTDDPETYKFRGWQIKNCSFTDVSGGSAYNGIACNGLEGLLVESCSFHALYASLGHCDLSGDSYDSPYVVMGCKFTGGSGACAVYLTRNRQVNFINNSVKLGYPFHIAADETGPLGLYLLNNAIWSTDGIACFTLTGDDFYPAVVVPKADGNIYVSTKTPPVTGAIFEDESDTYDFDSWQRMTRQDEHSFNDPSIDWDSDLIPNAGSRPIGNGVCASYSGNGKVRGVPAIDIGWAQTREIAAGGFAEGRQAPYIEERQ